MLLKKNKNNGFTLIEAAIYMALFAIIIGGGMVVAYQIIEGSSRVSIKTTIEQEADFILRKIDWAIVGASSSSININGDELTIGSIIFSESGGNFQKNGVSLNISSIAVSNTAFVKNGTSPAGVKASFTLSSLDGAVSQDFSMTKYAKY